MGSKQAMPLVRCALQPEPLAKIVREYLLQGLGDGMSWKLVNIGELMRRVVYDAASGTTVSVAAIRFFLERQREQGALPAWVVGFFDTLHLHVDIGAELTRMGLNDTWFFECWGDQG